jgi:hypothetical protein
VGPFSTNSVALIIEQGHPIWLTIESVAAGEGTIERSADLRAWEPGLSVYSQVLTSSPQDASFRLFDRSINTLLSGAADAVFLRLRQGEAFVVSLSEWRKIAPVRYRFTYNFRRNDNVNTAPTEWSGKVTVENNQVVEVSDARLNGVPVTSPDYSQFETIEGLLGVIEEYKGAQFMTVSYDPVHLFPRLIQVNDWDDYGLRYEVSDWEALP